MDKAIQKLFIVRHAESLEDIDNMAYERISDEDMPLSEYGKSRPAYLDHALYIILDRINGYI